MSLPVSSGQRERHRLQVVDVLRANGTASRAEIARSTGLSRATVSGLVGELQEEGVVVERDGEHPSAGPAGGRPATRLALNPSTGSAIGVDFGHTHLHVAIADISSRVLAEREAELDVDRAAERALDKAVRLVHEVIEEAGVDRGRILGVGMGLPGPINRESGIVGPSVILSAWEGLRPAALLEERLGLPVTVDNDANLGALGELTFGAGIGARQLLYVKISSGIGAGLVIDGRIYRGATGVAGEFGHVLVNPDGALCRCGNRGCLETIAATGPLLELLHPTHGADFGVEDLIAEANAGDAGCRRVLADAGRALGLELAGVCNVINPERVVIGGELSAAREPLLDGIRDSLTRHAQPLAHDAVELVAGVLGARAEVLGALAVVIADPARMYPARMGAQPADLARLRFPSS
jgi:predicted NBD/HSP70 family sugar kinase